MRLPFIAANWKMNDPPEGWEKKHSPYHRRPGVDVVVFPTFLHIAECLSEDLIVGAQYGHPEHKGAYTGDVSMQMLAHLGCTYVLCGHSERRRHHNETDTWIAEQVAAAVDAGLKPNLLIR